MAGPCRGPERLRLIQLFAILIFVTCGVHNAQTEEQEVSSGLTFLQAMRSLSGQLNLTLRLPAGNVVNVTEGLLQNGGTLPPLQGAGFADAGLISVIGPPVAAEQQRAVVDLGCLKDVTVRCWPCKQGPAQTAAY